ncbi:TolC family protein [Sphingomonas sp. DT-204]|uniref:TolC family protein n=1 Tax=Sphingomonas sp. DT-204 TaxID=3396166 RepID=UPI003F540118
MLCLAGEAGAADTGEPVTLEGAAREAVAWHPSVIEAVGRLNARAEEVSVARAGYYPQIRAGIGSSYDNRLGSQWRPRPQVTASQMLYDFGKVSGAVASARAGTRIGQAQVLLAVDGLIRDTAYAAIEVQRGAALHQVALDQLASIRQISELVRNRYTRGAATRSDALQAQARVEAAEATLTQIEAARRRWASNLAFLLGRNAPPQVVPDVPQWLMTACVRAAPDWTQVPAIMAAEAGREQASADLRRSRAERLPTISVDGGASADITSPLSNRSQYNFGISVSSSVFSGGALRARQRGAAFALAAAEAAVADARNEAGQRLAEAQQQIASLSDLLDTLASRQAKMAETGRLYRLQYLEMGTRTLVDLLNAEQELHQVRFDAANTAHDLRRLEVDCLYYSGGAREGFGLSGRVVMGVTL